MEHELRLAELHLRIAEVEARKAKSDAEAEARKAEAEARKAEARTAEADARKAEAEAKAEARKVEAEAKAEARKAEAKAEAEARKAEAEANAGARKADAEARKADAEARKAEAEARKAQAGTGSVQQVVEAHKRALGAQLDRLTAAVAALDARLAAHEHSTLAPWAELAPSSSRHRKEFRSKVVCLHYGSCEQPAACMVSGVTLSGEKGVSGAHIWPAISHGRGLSKFGLSTASVHDARNGLLLLKVIEEAFDMCRVAIEVTVDDAFVFRVMDPALESSTVYGLTTFGQLNGRALAFPGQQRPFRRLLMWHLSFAVDKALQSGWRSEAELERFACLGPTGKVHAWLERLSPGTSWPGQQQCGVELVKAGLKLSLADSSSKADDAESDSASGSA